MSSIKNPLKNTNKSYDLDFFYRICLDFSTFCHFCNILRKDKLFWWENPVNDWYFVKFSKSYSIVNETVDYFL